MQQRRILVISTGGTIAMTRGARAGIVPTLTGEDLIRAVPELAQAAVLEVHSFSTKPGASLTLEDLIEIAELINSRSNEPFSGVVVVQGTDMIEETSFVLDLLVKSRQPVVVTGAMRNRYRGVVVEAMGAGHLPARLVNTISNLIERMPVVLSTRVASGPILTKTYGFPGSEIDLIERGAIPGGCLAGLKACILLRLLVANGFEGSQLKWAFAQSCNDLDITPKPN